MPTHSSLSIAQSLVMAGLSVALAACASAEGGESVTSTSEAILDYCPASATVVSNGFGVIKVDATNIYLGQSTSTGTNLVTCPSGGCSATPTVLAATGTIWDMAIDATNVYWSNDAHTIYECAKTGCGGRPTVLASGQPYASRIATDGTNVYWTNFYPGSVMSCPVGGCNGAPTVLATNQTDAEQVASDGTNVFWASNNQLMACAVGGCNQSPSVFASWAGGTSIEALATDATNVYVSVQPSTGLASVVKIAKSNGALTTIAASQNLPEALAVDATRVYWTATGYLSEQSGGTFGTTGGGIWAAAIAGGSPQLLLDASVDGPAVIAVDATSVYWAQGNVSANVADTYDKAPKTPCVVFRPPPCHTPCCEQEQSAGVTPGTFCEIAR